MIDLAVTQLTGKTVVSVEQLTVYHNTRTDKQGKGLRIRLLNGELGFSAQHYADEELWQAKYHHQLKNIFRPEVILHLDAAMRGLGNASCGPGPLQKYELNEKSYNYTFVIEPVL